MSLTKTSAAAGYTFNLLKIDQNMKMGHKHFLPRKFYKKVPLIENITTLMVPHVHLHVQTVSYSDIHLMDFLWY